MTKSEQRPKRSGEGPQSKPLALGVGITVGRPGKALSMGLVALGCVAVAGLLVFLLIPKSDQNAPLQIAQGSGPKSGLPEKFTAETMRAEAVEVAQDLVEDFAHDAKVLVLAAMLYDQLGKSEESMACWQKCMNRHPRRADVARGLGQAALRRGEYGKAVSVLRQAVEIEPRTTGVHYLLASALMSLGEHTEAISHFEKEIEMAPSAAHSHYMLGQARQQLGQYELAGRSYQAALKIQPDNMNALYGLAIVLTRLGDKTRAAECRRKYTELNRAGLKTEITRMSQSFDDDAAMRKLLVSAHREAGRAYASARRSDDAERHWRRAIAIDPGDLRCRTVLVNFFLHGRRNVSEARRLALAAVALDPSAAKWALLARSHHANGDMAPARAAVKRAIAEDPANQSYRQILRMIEGGI